MTQVTEYADFTEYRAEPDSSNLSGYAASYLTVDSHGSAFSRRAFTKTLRERGDRIPVLYNHDSDKLVGKVEQFRSDQKGLGFNAKIVEESMWGKEVMVLARAGALTGMSFGFRSIKERPGLPTDGIVLDGLRGVKPEEIRFIEEVHLKEISAATFPSNDRAGITKYRSEEDRFKYVIEELRELGIDDERVESLLASIQGENPDTPDGDEPPDGTRSEDESRHELDTILIELTLAGVHL